MRRAVIVGGGISGLAAAYELARAHVPCALIERSPRLGGVIRTERIGGCLVEAGPDSFLAEKPWASELIRELGLAGEIIGSNDRERVTYVLKRGRLRPLPDGLMMMVPTRVWPVLTSRLLGFGTKWRMATEWFHRPRRAGQDRSVAEFVSEHYGREAVDYLAEPLLAGVYGGDASELGVAAVLPRFLELERRYGSLTRGLLVARRTGGLRRAGSLFETLRDGLGRLVEVLAAEVRRCGEILYAEAETVERMPTGYRVRASGQWLSAEHIVLACPAWEAARVVRALDPVLSDLLEAIPYRGSITVSLGYPRSLVHPMPRGFGFLVPKCERHRLLACTWVGAKFPHREPPYMLLMRCFLGGDDLLGADEHEITDVVRHELARILDVRAEPSFVRVARWPRSMPQYTVGHRERVEAVRARLAAWPGLLVAGNAYEGIGVPDCVRSGRESARRILAQLG
ncbi:MAG: protoporphyrinogen oxidase [Bryobacterales bacterium]|nr:protoporphyrinogen oxidase [Bryobacteraceae bacterium]MDW8129923.1 protoporphyrinogen oxidase [Bryobacterales bacterium]